MIHTLKTPPVLKPVALADMRAKIGTTRADDTSRDAIIEQAIGSATHDCENYTGKAFITQTWVYYAYSFDRVIGVKMPVKSVTSITYLDQNNIRQTVSPADYGLDPHQGIIVPKPGKSWPVALYHNNSVQIEYVCGYGDSPSDVPDNIKEAIMLIVGQAEKFQHTAEAGIRPLTIPMAATQLLRYDIDYRGLFGKKPG